MTFRAVAVCIAWHEAFDAQNRAVAPVAVLTDRGIPDLVQAAGALRVGLARSAVWALVWAVLAGVANLQPFKAAAAGQAAKARGFANVAVAALQQRDLVGGDVFPIPRPAIRIPDAFDAFALQANPIDAVRV